MKALNVSFMTCRQCKIQSIVTFSSRRLLFQSRLLAFSVKEASVTPLWQTFCLHDPPASVCVCVQVVGLYRLCGSAAVKKELREAFERDSHGVELCENTYPDVNVITGKLIAGT